MCGGYPATCCCYTFDDHFDNDLRHCRWRRYWYWNPSGPNCSAKCSSHFIESGTHVKRDAITSYAEFSGPENDPISACFKWPEFETWNMEFEITIGSDYVDRTDSPVLGTDDYDEGNIGDQFDFGILTPHYKINIYNNYFGTGVSGTAANRLQWIGPESTNLTTSGEFVTGTATYVWPSAGDILAIILQKTGSDTYEWWVRYNGTDLQTDPFGTLFPCAFTTASRSPSSNVKRLIMGARCRTIDRMRITAASGNVTFIVAPPPPP